MKKDRHEVAVGMFVIIGFLVLTVTVFFVSGVYLFKPGYKIHVMYEYVSILNKGAPIRMAGVRIGEVDDVNLVFDKEKGHIRVKITLFINNGIEVRENYQFFIRGTHILSEPHIEISPVEGNAPVIKPGTLLEGIDPVPVEEIVEKAHAIAGHLEAVLGAFRNASGADDGGETLKGLLINLEKITKSLSIAMDGNEENLKDSLENLHESSEAMTQILTKMQAGEGTAGKLLMTEELHNELMAFVKEIKTRPWRLMKKDDGKFLGIF